MAYKRELDDCSMISWDDFSPFCRGETLRNTRRDDLEVAVKAKNNSVQLLRMGDSGSAAPSDFPPALN
jgi:hypothetical protein